MSRVVSINISPTKGTLKTPIPEVNINERGIVGDAHAGAWHRQVSLLSKECIDFFGRQSASTFNFGDFAENLTTEGIDLATVAIRDCLTIGDVELEITQIGKECHGGGCAVFRQVGKCVMPKEGIFTRVLRTGHIRTGDAIVHHPRPLRIQVITLSDRASRGEYEDRSGPAIEEAVQTHFADSRWHPKVSRTILPDDAEQLQTALRTAFAQNVDVILTTGGTGIGPHDITPDVVAPLLDKQIPGIMEFIRVKHGERLPSALLSRAVAGVAGQTLIYTMPGSVKAVKEYLEVILPTLQHSLLMLWAIDAH